MAHNRNITSNLVRAILTVSLLQSCADILNLLAILIKPIAISTSNRAMKCCKAIEFIALPVGCPPRFQQNSNIVLIQKFTFVAYLVSN